MIRVKFVRLNAEGIVVFLGQTDAEALERMRGMPEHKDGFIEVPLDLAVAPGDWFNRATKKAFPPRENPARLQGTKLLDLPKPSTLTIEGTDYVVKSGTADLSFSLPGTYVVRVNSGPRFRETSFTVDYED